VIAIKYITVISLVLTIAAYASAQYFFIEADQLIESHFGQIRKWDLPSKIYSDAEYIYPGIDISQRKLINKLHRLGYRTVDSDVTQPGEYRFQTGKLIIYLHDFKYPESFFKGFQVQLNLHEYRITSIYRIRDNKKLPLMQLEPELISSVYNEKMEDRSLVSLKEVPQHLVNALILIEDERFFQHRGIDPIGILRATWINLKSFKFKQGGSTLTQQLVKNYFLTSKKTISRKIKEMLIAYRLEQTHTKAEIIEAYLNEVYLAQRGAASIAGVGAASKHYFSKNVNQLTLAECALLAGTNQNPWQYNPERRPKVAKRRRDFVLRRMYEKSFISEKEYKHAVNEKINVSKQSRAVTSAPYFIDFVKRQLSELYSKEILQTQGLRIFTTLDMSMQINAQTAVYEGLSFLEKTYASKLNADHPLQTCMVAMQPSSGYIRALVGGRDYHRSQFDRCTQAMRQPGSTFKPFVYLTALDPARTKKIYTPSSLLLDETFEIESGGEIWQPKNYDKKEHGWVTIRHALEKSLNISTAKLAIDIGLDNIIRSARDAGITSALSAVPSLSLGAFEVTPMEMLSAYSIFPNKGIRVEPISIIHVMDNKGNVLNRKKVMMERKFDNAPVYLTTHLLRGVVDNGTGKLVRKYGYSAIAAGKTGTTSSYRDAWFIGFTPRLLSLTWVGYDNNTSMNLSGSTAAIPLWVRFMKQSDPTGYGNFAGPRDVVLVKVDEKTGGRIDHTCPRGIDEAFIQGTEPQQSCQDISKIIIKHNAARMQNHSETRSDF